MDNVAHNDRVYFVGAQFTLLYGCLIRNDLQIGGAHVLQFAAELAKCCSFSGDHIYTFEHFFLLIIRPLKKVYLKLNRK